MVGYGSIILGVPLRHTHAAGAQVVLARSYQPGTPIQNAHMRGEAQRHRPAGKAIPSQGGLSDSDAESLAGFVDDQAWSEAEREHQETRHRRKGRLALRPVVRALPAPPVVSQTIRQPDKFHCPPLPLRGAVEAFEDKIVAEFRSFTSLGEAAEAYLRATFEAAKACTAHEADPIWEQAFEDLSCDQTQFVIADEKVKCAMQPLLSDQQQARWRLRAKARRDQGLPAATARQLLFFVLSFHHIGAKHEGENALFALMRLRDKCVQEPLNRAPFKISSASGTKL